MRERPLKSSFSLSEVRLKNSAGVTFFMVMGQCVHGFRLYLLGLAAGSVQHMHAQPVFGKLRYGEMKG